VGVRVGVRVGKRAAATESVGPPCGAAHAGMLHDGIAIRAYLCCRRQTTLKSFRNAKFEVLVATDVAARGLDISGIELVVQVRARRPPWPACCSRTCGGIARKMTCTHRRCSVFCRLGRQGRKPYVEQKGPV